MAESAIFDNEQYDIYGYGMLRHEMDRLDLKFD